jgi:hypothetical protein
MGSTISSESASRTILWIMLIAISCIIIITAIAYFSYKHTENFYNNIRLGHVYVFDAMTKYKKTITYALSILFIIVIISFYK